MGFVEVQSLHIFVHCTLLKILLDLKNMLCPYFPINSFNNIKRQDELIITSRSAFDRLNFVSHFRLAESKFDKAELHSIKLGRYVSYVVRKYVSLR